MRLPKIINYVNNRIAEGTGYNVKRLSILQRCFPVEKFEVLIHKHSDLYQTGRSLPDVNVN